ncbi:Hypothetical predicted protein [Olea europaea subsp. europaea]|uniref:Uncharacterized protein n=1 Tax=Olea europaea subsp. europaea TaxID=158383 RepID=A0A8S0PC63_OLEEU|nr:Hypothetical predicted protein [Olea europaea subsp. europaea]
MVPPKVSNGTPEIQKSVNVFTIKPPKTSAKSRRRKSNNIEVRYVVPSDDERIAPYMSGISYKKPMQPQMQRDMDFGDTGGASTSVPIQSHKPRTRLLMITNGCKENSSDVEDDDDDDDDFVDTPSKR